MSNPDILWPVAAIERAGAVASAARDLLDALDRMYGTLSLSPNVQLARAGLRELLPSHDLRDPADRADEEHT